MAARRAHNPEVVGSSPASATIKTPGIHYEYRDFSNFLAQNENASKSVLGQFWVTYRKNCRFGSPLGSFADQYISNTFGSFGFVFLYDVGIEAFGGCDACVTELL